MNKNIFKAIKAFYWANERFGFELAKLKEKAKHLKIYFLIWRAWCRRFDENMAQKWDEMHKK